MDPHSFIARAEAQRWLGISEKLLMGHDLVGAKTFAIRARESDPRVDAADQILAITDTLLAAEKRVAGSNGTQQPDFYAILQLVRFVEDAEHIADQYRRLAVALNPRQNRFPYADQAFQAVNEAWAVLSNPMRKSMYDEELDFPQQMNHIGFNLEEDYHHQQHHHQQQHQHNFFSINRMGSGGHEQELVEPQETFQARVQRNHEQQQLQQHNFLLQSNPVRPSPVREQEQLFQQREQDQLLQPFQITSTPPRQLMRSPTPPPPAAPPQPPVSWPPAPPRSQPQYQQPPPPMRSPTPPPPVAPPQPPVSWSQSPPHSLPQPPIQASTAPHPAAPTQPPVSWPEPPPHSPPQPQNPQTKSQPQHHRPVPPPPQPQSQLQVEQQSPEQNSIPVDLPTHFDTNNGESEEESERATDADSENVDTSPTFWTACPYCLYMYEYPRIYSDFTLRCDNCDRAFQAVPVPSPPPITDDQQTYFCCWGSFPLGLSISHLDNNKIKGTHNSWTPFSPIHNVSPQIHNDFNVSTSPTPKKNRNWGPRVYVDDVTDDIFTDISEPSDDSDIDWNGNNNNNKTKKKTKKRGRKRKSKVIRKKRNTNLVGEPPTVNLVNLPESSKTGLMGNPRRQSGRVGKEMGKLDLNVEFDNNEGEEGGRKIGGNREDENIEGIGFFEGLDEFFSSLPILSNVNEEKVKEG